jgi:hypothetical protein
MKCVFKYTILIVYLAIILSACAKDETSSERLKEYETCCGADPVEVAVGEKEKLYVPNSFTPNKDGKNDVFRPFYTGDIRNMTYMLFYSLEGDTLLYILRGSDINNFENGMWGWDGTRTGGDPLYSGDWKLHKGGFKYEISIFSEDQGFVSIIGKACSIHCGVDASVFKDNAACFFPSQVNEDGTFNPQIANNDSDCFK